MKEPQREPTVPGAILNAIDPFLRMYGEKVMPAPTTRPRVRVVFNQKGGVGKTTLSVNLASCAAMAGRRTLLVDADPNANATTHLLGVGQPRRPHAGRLLRGLPGPEPVPPVAGRLHHRAHRGQGPAPGRRRPPPGRPAPQAGEPPQDQPPARRRPRRPLRSAVRRLPAGARLLHPVLPDRRRRGHRPDRLRQLQRAGRPAGAARGRRDPPGPQPPAASGAASW